MTPMKESTFATNAAPIPTAAIREPASAGPTARARLNSIPLSAEADASSSFGTSSGRTARHVGVSNASPAERANVSASNSHGVIWPVMVSTAITIATEAIHDSVNRISLRRSNMSPAEPAGRASRKNGSEEAVCVRAIYIGPAPSDTINHAAPTLCMNVPISEITSAISKFRKTAIRSGRHTLDEEDGFKFF